MGHHLGLNFAFDDGDLGQRPGPARRGEKISTGYHKNRRSYASDHGSLVSWGYRAIYCEAVTEREASSFGR